MSVGPQTGEDLPSMSFRVQRCLWGQADVEGGRAKRGSLKVLYPSVMFIGGIGLQRPHSPVLGNVVFLFKHGG